MSDDRTPSKARTIAYWICTVLVAFFFAWSGAAMLHPAPEMIEGMQKLGYPGYVMYILGFWKLTGGITIIAPRFPRLKGVGLRRHLLRPHGRGGVAFLRQRPDLARPDARGLHHSARPLLVPAAAVAPAVLRRRHRRRPPQDPWMDTPGRPSCR